VKRVKSVRRERRVSREKGEEGDEGKEGKYSPLYQIVQFIEIRIRPEKFHNLRIQVRKFGNFGKKCDENCSPARKVRNFSLVLDHLFGQ
jgi:hypothetical protein